MELSRIDCSYSLLYKYKPFYIIPPTEREQQSCLCTKCQNSHLVFKGVDSYRKMTNLSQHTYVTTFLHDSQSSKLSDRTDIYPEFNNEKEINY